MSTKPIRVVGFDTETTGVDPSRDHVVQFAFVEALLNPTTQQITEKKAVQVLLRLPPGERIPAEAAAVHGITDAMLKAEGKHPRAVWSRFLELVSSDLSDATFVAHNLPFDVAMMRRAFELHLPASDARDACEYWQQGGVLNMVDTLAIARRIYGRGSKRSKTPGNNLEGVCRKLGLEFSPLAAHEALYDVRKTIEVFGHLSAIEAGGRQAARDARRVAKQLIDAPAKASVDDDDREVLEAEVLPPEDRPAPSPADAKRLVQQLRTVEVPERTTEVLPAIQPLIDDARAVCSAVADDIAAVVEIAEALEVDSPEANAIAVDLQGRIKTAANVLTEKRKAISAPVSDATSQIQAEFREGPLARLKDALSQLEDRCDAFAKREIERKAREAREARKRKREAERRAAEAAKAADTTGVADAVDDVAAEERKIEDAQTTGTKTKGATATVHIVFTVEGVEDLEQVPREFLTLDRKAVEAHILKLRRELPEAEHIEQIPQSVPGVRIGWTAKQQTRRRTTRKRKA